MQWVPKNQDVQMFGHKSNKCQSVNRPTNCHCQDVIGKFRTPSFDFLFFSSKTEKLILVALDTTFMSREISSKGNARIAVSE